MVSITLPDGSKKEFSEPVTGEQIAASIGAGLAKAALAIRVDGLPSPERSPNSKSENSDRGSGFAQAGKLLDLYIPIEKDASIQIITGKDADGLELIRHDTAHLLAEAVKELFPETQVTIGPAIENGFYYDFSRPTPFSSDDLGAIEQRMKEIVARNEQVRREAWKRDDAVKFFQSIGEKYKAEIIGAIPADQEISLYRQGEFIDLCRGPHAPSTGKVGTAFKLLKVAGAYWRGDHRNEMLQRIYGTAWANEKDLKAYLTLLEEAEKRDHRRLGKELDLFHIEEHTPGMVFWHDKGWTIYRTIENYIRGKIRAKGYIEVKTPILVDRTLWEQSGHWEKFRENMFVALTDEDKHLCVKPMNCPCHIQIFKQGMKSYRDLPLRMAEFGSCHRNEPSGSLHGIMRIRGFTQDDAHIFCTEDQITSETVAFCDLLKEIYTAFGFKDIKVKFSDRPPTRAGEDATWDKAEGALKEAVNATGLEWTLNPGEGAFYGPKLEFVLRDAIGRDWQCGTLQVDFVLPERLDANYIAPDGSKKRPVMLHRAILGSLERFIGILIEEYSGKFPLWLTPTQVVVATITEAADGYAKQIHDELLKAGLRSELDTSNNKINYKVRDHSLKKIPVMFVVGNKEAESKSVSIRRLGSEKQEVMGFDEAMRSLLNEAKTPH
jgi:threonyl-tRNA synthetase